MLKFSERRVNLFVLIERILSTLVDDFITDGIFANLALKRLIAVVKAVWGLIAHSFAPEPALETLKVNKFNSSHAKTNIEEWIASGLG